MRTIEIPDSTFLQLADQAASRNVAVSDLVVEILSRSEWSATARPPLTGEAWRHAFDAFCRRVESHVGRLPPGHVVDTGRESIYEERERDQL